MKFKVVNFKNILKKLSYSVQLLTPPDRSKKLLGKII